MLHVPKSDLIKPCTDAANNHSLEMLQIQFGYIMKTMTLMMIRKLNIKILESVCILSCLAKMLLVVLFLLQN